MGMEGRRERQGQHNNHDTETTSKQPTRNKARTEKKGRKTSTGQTKIFNQAAREEKQKTDLPCELAMHRDLPSRTGRVDLDASVVVLSRRKVRTKDDHLLWAEAKAR